MPSGRVSMHQINECTTAHALTDNYVYTVKLTMHTSIDGYGVLTIRGGRSIHLYCRHAGGITDSMSELCLITMPHSESDAYIHINAVAMSLDVKSEHMHLHPFVAGETS